MPDSLKSREPARRLLTRALPLLPLALLATVSASMAWHQSAVPGFWLAIPTLLVCLYFWARLIQFVAMAEPPTSHLRVGFLGAACALLVLVDHLQYFYLPAGTMPEAIDHPAVEVMVDRATLNELGIAPHLEGVFFAPGRSNRDLYLWAGQRRRSYLRLVPVLAARPAGDPEAKWRVGMGKPLEDARWLPQTGRILTAIPEPPMLELRDAATLEVIDGVTWSPGGYPTLLDVQAEGPVRAIAEGEGEMALVDPRTLSLESEPALAPQARTLGADIKVSALAPAELSAPVDGRRYLSSWYGYMIALELDPDFRVTRAFVQPRTRPNLVSTFTAVRFFGVAPNPDGSELWIANSMLGRRGEIIELDRNRFEKVRSYDAPVGIRGLLYDERRRRLYALDALGGSLIVYRRGGDGLEEVTRLQFGKLARVLQWEDETRTHLLVGSAGGLFRVDPNRL